MLQSDFAAHLAAGLYEAFDLFSQPVTWNGQALDALLDDIPFSNSQRSEGGGLEPEFEGQIIFKKTAFEDSIPKVGDTVQVGARSLRLVEIAASEDPIDPLLAYRYRPLTA